jgi:hypothetical protein
MEGNALDRLGGICGGWLVIWIWVSGKGVLVWGGLCCGALIMIVEGWGWALSGRAFGKGDRCARIGERDG